MEDVCGRIAEHVLDARYENLPGEVVEAAKKALVNTVGCVLAGSSSVAAKAVVEMVPQWGGASRSSILLWGDKVPAPNAALANCTMARCRELDDVHENGGGHVSVVSIPTCLAIAEAGDRPVSGKDFILSAVLGGDLTARLMGASGERIGWTGEVTAPFGVVASGAKMLRMNKEKIADAMGIAFMQCAGSLESGTEGTWGLWLAAGFAARAGITSLQLADRGYPSMKAPLTGPFGLYPLYFRGRFNSAWLFDELGKRFEIPSIKPYSSCKVTHHSIYTTMKLVKEHGLRASDIQDIKVVTHSHALKLVVYDQNGQVKCAPKSIAEANFSLPFTVAVGVVKGGVFLDTLTEETLRDPAVLALARLVKVTASAEKDELRQKTGFAPADVSIRTKDGKVYSGSEEFVKGHPRNPMSRGECAEMFHACLAFADKPVDMKAADEFLSMAWSLDEVTDVRPLVKLLC